MSQNDKSALEMMQNSAKLQDSHYEIELPWKNDPLRLDVNKSVAMHRLSLLKKRLSKDPDLLSKYREGIADLLTKGYAKKAPAASTALQGKLWYLPHHPVFHPAKPNKVRVVRCGGDVPPSACSPGRLQRATVPVVA